MENTYNVRISFKGEGSFNFTLPGYGELTVYTNKDVFVKGLSVSGIELLRQLRPLLLQHQLNAKADGCFKVIDLTKTETRTPITQPIAKAEPTKSVADLKNELVKTTGPIDPNEGKEVVTSTGDVKTEEPSVKAPEEVKPKVEQAKPKAPKTNTKKKTNKNKSTKK